MFVDPRIFRDKKAEIVQAIKGLFDKFNIPTTEKIAGVYPVDLIRELSKKLNPVPPEKVDEGLDYLIAELTKIRKGV
jgi:hypothetical protein